MTTSKQQGLASLVNIILIIGLILAAIAMSGCAGMREMNGGATRSAPEESTDLVDRFAGRLEGSYQIEATIDSNGHEVYLISVPYEAARLKITLAGEFVLLEVLDRGKSSLIIREGGIDVVNLPGKER